MSKKPILYKISHLHIPDYRKTDGMGSAHGKRETFLVNSEDDIPNVLEIIHRKYPGRPHIVVDETNTGKFRHLTPINPSMLVRKTPEETKTTKKPKKKENKLRKVIRAVNKEKNSDDNAPVPNAPSGEKITSGPPSEALTRWLDAVESQNMNPGRAAETLEEEYIKVRRTCSYCGKFWPPGIKYAIGFCAGCAKKRYCLNSDCQLEDWIAGHQYECRVNE